MLELESILGRHKLFLSCRCRSASTNKIFDVDVNAETVLLEPSYPVLDTTGDSLQVGTGNYRDRDSHNFDTGDKELIYGTIKSSLEEL